MIHLDLYCNIRYLQGHEVGGGSTTAKKPFAVGFSDKKRDYKL